MLPSMYGCSAQQSSALTASLTISTITITTIEYGTDESNLQTIDPSQQISTVLNSSNSFTVPTDGLAQYYSNNDVSQQVFHSMRIQYTANNFDINDLSTSEVQAVYETTLNQTPTNSGLNTWLTQAVPSAFQGTFIPGASSQTGIIANTIDNISETSLTRNDFFQVAPTIGTSTIPLLSPTNGFAVKSAKGNQPIEVDRLVRLKFAAQNLGSSSSIDIKLKILLKDGTYAEGTQTITVPAGAVKDNIVALETFDLQTITITPKKSVPPEAIFPQLELPPGTSIPVVLNSGNSFTIPSESLYYEDETNFDPSIGAFYRVGNSFEVSFDTSTLTASNFPEFEVQAEIVVSSPGYPDDFTWYQDGGNASQTFAWETEERSQIITGGVVTPLIAYPLDTDEPFITGIDINGRSDITVKVRIQNSVGVFVESNTITITVSADGITNLG